MTHIEYIYGCFKKSNGITTDTRQCKEGMMFVALRGENFDGNCYAAEALEKGCSYVVVDNSDYADEANPKVILVEDSLRLLQQLARYHRRQLGTTIVGITGTNGKTTTKELVATVLRCRYNILYTQGNLNNHIGVPLTLLQMNETHEMAIVEMGANHPGDIKELVEIAEPDYGVITNVGMAHLQGFGSLEGVIRTKGELYDHIRQTETCTIFLNNDNAYLKDIAGELTTVRYGQIEDKELTVYGELIACDPYLRFRWVINGEAWDVSTQLIGSYNLDNALCAATIGTFFGVSPEEVSNALASYMPTNNRSQLTKTERNTLIVDAYNANPTSMRAALENFARMEVAPKMVILGDMKELGEATADAHQEVVDYLIACQFDEVWLVGTAFAATQHGGVRVFVDAENVKEELQKIPVEKKYILVKGSNSMKLSSLVPYL